MLRRTEYSRKASGNSVGSLWARFRVWWLGLDDYYRCIAPIVGLNVLVWILWRAPRCYSTMTKYFLCQPYVSKASSLCVGIGKRGDCVAVHLFSPGVLAPGMQHDRCSVVRSSCVRCARQRAVLRLLSLCWNDLLLRFVSGQIRVAQDGDRVPGSLRRCLRRDGACYQAVPRHFGVHDLPTVHSDCWT